MGGCPSCAAPERERIVVAPGTCGRVVCVCLQCGERSQGEIARTELVAPPPSPLVRTWFTVPAEA